MWEGDCGLIACVAIDDQGVGRFGDVAETDPKLPRRGMYAFGIKTT